MIITIWTLILPLRCQCLGEMEPSYVFLGVYGNLLIAVSPE